MSIQSNKAEITGYVQLFNDGSDSVKKFFAEGLNQMRHESGFEPTSSTQKSLNDIADMLEELSNGMVTEIEDVATVMGEVAHKYEISAEDLKSSAAAKANKIASAAGPTFRR